jgi:hypothetical protein
VVIRHMIDPTAHGTAPHQPSISRSSTGPTPESHSSFPRIEPRVVAVSIKDDRHAGTAEFQTSVVRIERSLSGCLSGPSERSGAWRSWVRPCASFQPQSSHQARSWTRKTFLQGLTERLNRRVLAKLANFRIRHDVLKTHLPANGACHLDELGDLLLGQQVDL